MPGGGAGTTLADWHVDGDIAVSGDGTTLETAFKTIAELSGNWAAGESVWIQPMDDDSAYEEQVTTPGAGCSVLSSGRLVAGAWAGGAKISAYDTIPAESWGKTDGQTNIWEITLSGMGAYGASLCGLNPCENGAQMTYYSSLANLDAQTIVPGYFVANPGTATPTLYVNRDPTTNGQTYKYNKRDACITPGNDVTDKSLTIRGLWCDGGYQTGGVIRVCESSTVTHNKITRGNKYSLFIRDGCTASYNQIVNGHHPTETVIIQLLYNQTSPTGLGVTISNNVFTHSTTAPRSAACSAIGGHVNTDGTMGTVAISGNTATDFGYGFYTGQGCDYLNFSGNVISGTLNPYIFPATTVTTVNGDSVSGGPAVQKIFQFVAGANVTVTNFTASSANRASSGYMYINNANVTFVMTDSNWDCDDTAGGADLYVSAPTANITLARNTHKVDQNRNIYRVTAAAAGLTFASDYCTFDTAIGFKMEWLGTSYTDFATYQAAVAPNDANSTAG